LKKNADGDVYYLFARYKTEGICLEEVVCRQNRNAEKIPTPKALSAKGRRCDHPLRLKEEERRENRTDFERSIKQRQSRIVDPVTERTSQIEAGKGKLEGKQLHHLPHHRRG